MRPTSLFWLFSSVLLLANAAPVPLDSSELGDVGDNDTFEVDVANVDRRDLDEMVDHLQKRTKTAAVPKPTKAKATAKPKTVQPKTTAKPKTTATPKATTKPKTTANSKATAKPKTSVNSKAATKVTAKPKATATAKPTKPVTKAPTKATSKPVTATGAVGKTCPIRKPATKGARGYSLAKRAPFSGRSAAPAKITITLGGENFALTKAATQGGTAVTYTVDGAGDFAKTNLGGAFFKPLAGEIAVTDKLGLLVASGVDENCANSVQAEWIITKKSQGKRIRDTTGFQAAKAAGLDKCTQAIATAINSAKTAHLQFFKATGGNHNDVTEGNVLFSDNLQTAFFIDFGLAKASNFRDPDDDVAESLIDSGLNADDLCS